MDNKEVVTRISLEDIIPNRFQPREVFNEQALKELAVSIQQHGVIQPIIVRPLGSKFEIIAGERRFKASTMAGVKDIPAIVRTLDDKKASKIALLENLQRQDLTAIEEARTYQTILRLDDMTQAELARTMGKSQASVSNKLRLLSLPEEVQEALLKKEISERHARALIPVEPKERQLELLHRIINERMTVRSLNNVINNKEESTNNEGASSNETTSATVKELKGENNMNAGMDFRNIAPSNELGLPASSGNEAVPMNDSAVNAGASAAYPAYQNTNMSGAAGLDMLKNESAAPEASYGVASPISSYENNQAMPREYNNPAPTVHRFEPVETVQNEPVASQAMTSINPFENTQVPNYSNVTTNPHMMEEEVAASPNPLREERPMPSIARPQMARTSISKNIETPNDDVKAIIQSNDFRYAILAINNIAQDLAGKGIIVEQDKKTFSDHLEIKLTFRK